MSVDTYRIYQLGRDRKIAGPPLELEAKDDHEALCEAEALAAYMPTEVWAGARLVGSIPSRVPVQLSNTLRTTRGVGSPAPEAD